MKWRALSEEDLLECLQIEPRHLGAEIVGYKQAVEIWKSLIPNLSFNSGVFRLGNSGAAKRVIGFGACVFIKSEFAARELANPRPFINSRIIASIASDGSQVIEPSDLNLAQMKDGLDVVCLYGNYLLDLRPENQKEIEMGLPYGLATLLCGFRINRLLQESSNETQFGFLQSSGVWRVVQDFPGNRALHVLTREQGFKASGSLAQAIFHYEPPTLGLRDTDKHLLAEALQGGTDSELAARMHLSLPSIKKRWLALFERVAEARPDLLPADDGGWNGTRGPQKRHHILDYVRSNPVELRPYRLYS